MNVTNIIETEKLEREKPWLFEQDYLRLEEHGYDCMILRNGMGALCGYVGVDETHPWYGKHYDDIEAGTHGGMMVHGGLTFSGDRSDQDQTGKWWVGFDCAHAGDLMPKMVEVMPEFHSFGEDTYKDVNYVKAEISKLAKAALDAVSF